MPAGFNAKLDKPIVDNMLGRATQDLNVAFRNIEDTQAFVNSYVDADFESLGYSPTDIANIRSALGDLDQLRRIYEGIDSLAAAKDFRAFAERLWGTGFTGS